MYVHSWTKILIKHEISSIRFKLEPTRYDCNTMVTQRRIKSNIPNDRVKEIQEGRAMRYMNPEAIAFILRFCTLPIFRTCMF